MEYEPDEGAFHFGVGELNGSFDSELFTKVLSVLNLHASVAVSKWRDE